MRRGKVISNRASSNVKERSRRKRAAEQFYGRAGSLGIDGDHTGESVRVHDGDLRGFLKLFQSL